MASENRLYRGTIAVMNETKQRAFRHSIISLQTVAEEEEEESQIASVMYSYGQLSIELPDKEGEEKEGEEEEEGGGEVTMQEHYAHSLANILLSFLSFFHFSPGTPCHVRGRSPSSPGTLSLKTAMSHPHRSDD